MASTLNISLPDQDIAFVEARTQAGQFCTADEFFHQLLTNERERQNDLERMLLDTLHDEEGSIEIPDEVWENGSLITFLETHDDDLG